MGANMTDATRYVRTEAAAAYLGLSPRTLEKLRLTGGGPIYCRPPGRKVVLYDRDALDEWARAGRRRSTSDTTPVEAA